MEVPDTPTFGWLTGAEISHQVSKGRIVISPFTERLLNPNSYNYRLASCLRRIKNDIIDLTMEDEYDEIDIPASGCILYPGECYLGCTVEEFGSNYYASLVTGRSSVGRKFITNHVTAGLIDQGFLGKITLEITVHKKTRIYPHIPFGQIFWFTVAGRSFLYSGKYQHQDEPTLSRIHCDSIGGW